MVIMNIASYINLLPNIVPKEKNFATDHAMIYKIYFFVLSYLN